MKALMLNWNCAHGDITVIMNTVEIQVTMQNMQIL